MARRSSPSQHRTLRGTLTHPAPYSRGIAGPEKRKFLYDQVMMVELVTVGTVSSSLVHPRETFRRAVMAGSTSIIIAHNHPSGEIEPSDEDMKVTRLMFDAGN